MKKRSLKVRIVLTGGIVVALLGYGVFKMHPVTQKTTTEEVEKSVEQQESISTSVKTEEKVSKPKQKQEPIPKVKPKDSIATIVSFGDTLCHMPVIQAAYNEKKGLYDFSYMFKYVKKYFKKATISIGNCESPMAGKSVGYSGYPTFNAPGHLARDLKELGVEIMTTANNHCLDKGFSGLSSTLKFLDKAGIAHTGTARTKRERNAILVRNLNGIKTAFLSYTYGTNGIPVPKDKKFCVNLINRKFILKQIQQAKKEGAELIVASIHWGIEYQTKENTQQRDLASFLIKNDVKVILGSHPHVLQPMKWMKVRTDEGEERKGLVIYSQGNFFSNQTQLNTRNTAIFNIKIKKNGKTGKVTVKKATYIPLYMHIKEAGAKHRYQILDLNEIIKSYKANEGRWSVSMYKLAVTEKKRCSNLIR